MGSNVKKLNITEELAKILRNEEANFLNIIELNKNLSSELRKELGLKSASAAEKIKETLDEKCIIDDKLFIKKIARSFYLVFRQPDKRFLLLDMQKLMQKLDGKRLSKSNVPFIDEPGYMALLNCLIKEGQVSVKLGMDSKKNIIPLFSAINKALPLPKPTIEAFKAAFQALEQGKFYARICDMRRRLGWSAQEFDAMLTGLRDAGKIQLQTGDTDFFSEEEIRDSFRDENGFRKLTMMWRQ